jgi:hypothetical protein
LKVTLIVVVMPAFATKTIAPSALNPSPEGLIPGDRSLRRPAGQVEDVSDVW